MLCETWSQKQPDRSSCWLQLSVFALNICYLFVAFVSEAFFGLKKASSWLVSLIEKHRRECKPASKIDCRGAIHILFGCFGVFGRAYFQPVKYMCCRNSMASAQKEQIKHFLNSNNQQKHKMECPWRLFNSCLKAPISRLRDPPRGPHFLCCPIHIDNNNTLVLCYGWVVGWFSWVRLWVELISRKTTDAISYSYVQQSCGTSINICYGRLLFTCSIFFRLWGAFRVEESVELISQSCQKRLPWM